MKKLFLFIPVLLVSYASLSQATPYKVVFDITTKDTNVQKAIIRWCTLITESSPDAQLEVVYYGQSLDMVVSGKSVTADAVINLAAGKNVSFKVCEAAMKHHKIDKSQLLPGVGTVPDGIYEIILKQKEGYGYIKAGL